MGAEHPFNPVVTLLGDSPILTGDQQLSVQPLTFGHAAFLYTPYSISLQLQTQAQKEAQMAQNKQQHKQYKKYNNYNNSYQGSYQENMAHSPYGSYPPPYLAMAMPYPGAHYMDSGSSTSPKRGGNASRGPAGGYYAPPPHVHGGAPPMAGMIPVGQPPMHSMPMPIPAPYPAMYGAHGAPMFPPPMPYGGAGAPAYYQMHNSLPGSLGSSYGNPNMMPNMDGHVEQNP